MYLTYILKYSVSSKKTVYIIISLESFVDKCYEKFDVGGSVCKGINDGERVIPKMHAEPSIYVVHVAGTHAAMNHKHVTFFVVCQPLDGHINFILR